MNAYPFTLYKRSNRPYYFISFKDANGKYLNPISTKLFFFVSADTLFFMQGV